MNVLYLHGLESKPGGSKVKYLDDRFDMVYAPAMDYKNPELFQEMLDLCAVEEFDLIISSMVIEHLPDDILKAFIFIFRIYGATIIIGNCYYGFTDIFIHC